MHQFLGVARHHLWYRKTDQIKWTFDEKVDWQRRQREFFKLGPPGGFRGGRR